MTATTTKQTEINVRGRCTDCNKDRVIVYRDDDGIYCRRCIGRYLGAPCDTCNAWVQPDGDGNVLGYCDDCMDEEIAREASR